MRPSQETALLPEELNVSGRSAGLSDEDAVFEETVFLRHHPEGLRFLEDVERGAITVRRFSSIADKRDARKRSDQVLRDGKPSRTLAELLDTGHRHGTISVPAGWGYPSWDSPVHLNPFGRAVLCLYRNTESGTRRMSAALRRAVDALAQ